MPRDDARPCGRAQKKVPRGIARRTPGKKTAATYSPADAVPSARAGLTSLFGMGRGGTPPLSAT